MVRIYRALVRQINKSRRGRQPAESAHQINERMMAVWTSRVGWFTGALVIVGLITAWIFQGQLNVMQAEQRPVLWTGTNLGTPMFNLNPQTGQGQVYWTVHYMNYGRGFTKSGTAKTFIKLGDHNFEQSYGQPKFATLAPVAPNQDVFLTVVSKPGTTPDEFGALSKREDGFSVKFEISYLDLAGQTFETGFCLTKLLSGAIMYCPAGNYVK
jgi:hypothetical protein